MFLKFFLISQHLLNDIQYLQWFKIIPLWYTKLFYILRSIYRIWIICLWSISPFKSWHFIFLSWITAILDFSLFLGTKILTPKISIIQIYWLFSPIYLSGWNINNRIFFFLFQEKKGSLRYWIGITLCMCKFGETYI